MRIVQAVRPILRTGITVLNLGVINHVRRHLYPVLRVEITVVSPGVIHLVQRHLYPMHLQMKDRQTISVADIAVTTIPANTVLTTEVHTAVVILPAKAFVHEWVAASVMLLSHHN